MSLYYIRRLVGNRLRQRNSIVRTFSPIFEAFWKVNEVDSELLEWPSEVLYHKFCFDIVLEEAKGTT